MDSFVCKCEHCLESETPCFMDCEIEHPCEGCLEARNDQKDILHEIDFAQGRC